MADVRAILVFDVLLCVSLKRQADVFTVQFHPEKKTNGVSSQVHSRSSDSTLKYFI